MSLSSLSGLPELTGVRKVWFSDWYDGPLTGIALYECREYWFVMAINDDAGGHWDFEPNGEPVTVVEGDGFELCLVAARRISPKDTALKATGPDADAVLELVRTYA